MVIRIKLALILMVCLATGSLAHAGPTASPADFPDTPPEAPLLKPPPLPASFTETLDNGLEVVVVTSDEIPWVSASWYLLAGANYEPADKSGLAATTAELLRQGTEKHSADEIAELLDYHAIKLNGNAGHETTAIRVGSLTKDVDLAVQCLAEVVRTPVFPDKEVKRYIAQAANAMKISEADSGYWADREFRKRIYGRHFLSRLAGGTSDSLPKITRQDLVDYHRSQYMPNGSVLVFSGDIAADRAVELAKKYFGDWQPGERRPCTAEPIPEPADTHIYLVDRPGSTQSQIRFGHLGYRRSDPQYVPGQIFNQVFGGSFNSRLNSAVRVKEGLTYGASGGFSAGKDPGRFMAATFTKNESTAEALRTMLGVADSMRTEEPNEEELSDAQSYIIGQFGLSLETPQQVAGKVFDLKYYGLPGSYYETYLQQIGRLSSADVLAFAREALNLGKLTIVVVGNAEEVKDSLSEIAPVTVVKLDSDAAGE